MIEIFNCTFLFMLLECMLRHMPRYIIRVPYSTYITSTTGLYETVYTSSTYNKHCCTYSSAPAYIFERETIKLSTKTIAMERVEA